MFVPQIRILSYIFILAGRSLFSPNYPAIQSWSVYIQFEINMVLGIL